MKRNFANLYVLFVLLLTVMFDIFGYIVVHQPKTHSDPADIFTICSITSFLVLWITFFHFHLYNVRITSKRLQLGWICFRSYFTRTALKQQGNPLVSISYACIASHYFFLKSYKA